MGPVIYLDRNPIWYRVGMIFKKTTRCIIRDSIPEVRREANHGHKPRVVQAFENPEHNSRGPKTYATLDQPSWHTSISISGMLRVRYQQLVLFDSCRAGHEMSRSEISHIRGCSSLGLTQRGVGSEVAKTRRGEITHVFMIHSSQRAVIPPQNS